MEIIAEIGSNFETFEDCQAAIHEASLAGATAVKFQMFSEDELYGSGSTEYRFRPEWLSSLKQTARKNSLKFGVTAFSQRGLDIVSPYVDFYKIASAEMNLELKFHRQIPRIFSTGGSSLGEIIEMVRRNNLTPIDCIMYCVSAYPALYQEYCFSNLIVLMSTFPDCKIGISDHTNDVGLGINAALFDIDYLEKHFRPMATKHTSPDFPHAVNRDQFRSMVDGINAGEHCYFMCQKEVEFRDKHKRRWIEIDGVKKFVRPR